MSKFSMFLLIVIAIITINDNLKQYKVKNMSEEEINEYLEKNKEKVKNISDEETKEYLEKNKKKLYKKTSWTELIVSLSVFFFIKIIAQHFGASIEEQALSVLTAVIIYLLYIW